MSAEQMQQIAEVTALKVVREAYESSTLSSPSFFDTLEAEHIIEAALTAAHQVGVAAERERWQKHIADRHEFYRETVRELASDFHTMGGLRETQALHKANALQDVLVEMNNK